MKIFILIALLSFHFNTLFKAQIPNYVPSNGLIGWWPFNGNAIDESGNGNNGTVVGATLTMDRFGIPNKAYSFDGDGDYIDCGNASSINISGDISISVWINATDFNIQHGIVSKYGLYDLVTDANFSAPPLDKIRWNAGNTPFLFTNPILSNQWLHIVAVYTQNSGKKIYLNGQLFAIDPQTGVVSPNTNYNLYLGSHQPFNLSYWSWLGSLDDIGIWNRGLNECEIQSLYNGVLPSSSISAGTDQVVCKGDSVTLIASGAINFNWNNNVTDGIPFLPLSSDYYIVTGMDNNGCYGTDTVSVVVNNPSFFIQNEQAVDSYSWPVNGQTYFQSGTYYDTLTNVSGCDSVITLNLNLSFTELESLQLPSNKELLKMIDLNGKETPFMKNTILLFIYEDGTIERVFETE